MNNYFKDNMSGIIERINGLFNKIRGIKIAPKTKDILLSLFVGFIIAALSASGLFERFENITVDSMFRLRGQKKARNDIVIIGIDDTSLEILGKWPWPRSYHASFLQVVNKFNPKFVVFDILFPESDPDGDAAFADVADKCKNLYLAFHFDLPIDGEKTYATASSDAPSLPYLKYALKKEDKFLHATAITLPVRPLMYAAKRVCAINAPPDKDGSTRHLPLVIEFNGRLYPTLSLQLACDYLGVDIDKVTIKPGAVILPIQRGEIRVPIDAQGKTVLNFNGSIDTFKLYSYVRLLHDYNVSMKEGRGDLLEDLRDKVVFVGHMATGTVDSRITPFSNLYPAVGGHATALANILNRDLIRKAPVLTNVFLILFVSFLLGLLTRRGKKMFVNLGIMLVLFSVYSVFSFFSFVFLKHWVDTFAPLFAILLAYVAIAISHYEAVRYEKRILENELFIARNIQQSFLPKGYPKVPFLELAARCNPAKHVGGDLYDFAEFEGEKLGVVIGDVSGKGVPAALYMARAISEFRTASRMHTDASTTLKYINDVFVTEGMEGAFITMQYLIADLKSKKIYFSNGGHNTILHFMKKEKKVEELDTKGGMPLGLMDGVDFDNKEINFGKGDILYLYTDGISEAMDKRQRVFGLDRVKAILINNSELKSEEIMAKIFDEIARFSKGAVQHDDMTMVVIKVV